MIITTLALLFAGAPATPAATAPGACPYAVVARDATGRRTNVHRHPTLAAGKVAKLGSGTPVFVCGAKGGWLWVHFSEGRHTCRGTASGLDVRYARACAKGWVERHRIVAPR
ncbi:MAG: hypothetical protein HEQ22_02960 [Sphingopyxis sp.]|uniref:hypothetical protein n=1 Tax=Sphingopyxis sp. TaxID=1908224 RepID=UPI003D80BDC3